MRIGQIHPRHRGNHRRCSRFRRRRIARIVYTIAFVLRKAPIQCFATEHDPLAASACARRLINILAGPMRRRPGANARKIRPKRRCGWVGILPRQILRGPTSSPTSSIHSSWRVVKRAPVRRAFVIAILPVGGYISGQSLCWPSSPDGEIQEESGRSTFTTWLHVQVDVSPRRARAALRLALR